jgi:hypothetical protein
VPVDVDEDEDVDVDVPVLVDEDVSVLDDVDEDVVVDVDEDVVVDVDEDVVVLVDVDEDVVVDVDVLLDELVTVDVDEDVVVDVVVDDVVVDTEVVALEVRVDVCVVDGDVISQLKNVSLNWRLASSFIASSSSVVRALPVLAMMSSSSAVFSTMWTWPTMSVRQPRSKYVPFDKPSSCWVISRSSSSRPTMVLSRQMLMFWVVSTTLYFSLAALWSGPKNAQPSRFPTAMAALVALLPLPTPVAPGPNASSTVMASSNLVQSARVTSVLLRFVMCWHSYTYGVWTKTSA